MTFGRYAAAAAAASAAALAVWAGLAHAQTATHDDALALPKERSIGHIEPVHEFYGAMPSGVAKAPNGRLFVNYPRWGDDVPFTVGEIVDGHVVPYPNARINRPDPMHPGTTLLSVQNIVADYRNRLWILDTAAPKFAPPVQGGAKLVAVDLATDKVVKTIVFEPNVLLPMSYIDDVRFDFRYGKEGVAYLSDSSPAGPGGIIVVDLASGDAWRTLEAHPATQGDPAFIPVVEGIEMTEDGPGGKPAPAHFAADGLALSADGNILYFSPLSSRHLYSVATQFLRDRHADDGEVEASVRDLGEKGASDGLASDADGAVYAGDYERNSIRKMLPDGTWVTIAHDPRILWPDALSIGTDGYLYFTANQLNRQAQFNHGRDLRKKPYTLFRIRINAQPLELKPQASTP
ncbi:L-dopachrome tautomerase-related protein [Paraburkholderia sp. SOS3]|jgi:sugar lactone lactonase YvrE|uniref:L-dopachrome tautomerase-related protein n=1 Tax=Paraburkholderia sp. SOS3 TaxID=1926494 RepID=UPI00094742D3|nr:L-dopachrome tautomerase-related protein [Paraburkholderia sp. SOS3]APR38297.1 gluconolaconase [Paraburkholderia sp. SOS3]